MIDKAPNILDLSFIGHKMEVTDPIRDVITRKLNQTAQHFNHRIFGATIVLRAEKLIFSVEATLEVSGSVINAKGTSDTLYKAIDVMIDKLDRQLRDFKEHIQDNHKGRGGG